MKTFIRKEELNKKSPVELLGEDVREGLTAIVSVKIPDPKFSSQTKEKLVSSEVESVVSNVFNKNFNEYLLENPKEAMSILTKISIFIKKVNKVYCFIRFWENWSSCNKNDDSKHWPW